MNRPFLKYLPILLTLLLLVQGFWFFRGVTVAANTKPTKLAHLFPALAKPPAIPFSATPQRSAPITATPDAPILLDSSIAAVASGLNRSPWHPITNLIDISAAATSLLQTYTLTEPEAAALRSLVEEFSPQCQDLIVRSLQINPGEPALQLSIDPMEVGKLRDTFLARLSADLGEQNAQFLTKQLFPAAEVYPASGILLLPTSGGTSNMLRIQLDISDPSANAELTPIHFLLTRKRHNRIISAIPHQ